MVDDGWLRYRSYQGGDDAIGAIEQQVYQYPAVSNFAAESVDADTFRHRLWNATASGQYPSTAIPNEQAANADEDLVRVHAGHPALGTRAVLRHRQRTRRWRSKASTT